MAIRKNTYCHDNNYHKWWQRYVKTWFHQPSQKIARRFKRKLKLTHEAPRPIGKLRPEVRPPTPRHNMRTRKGRGYSLEELKKVGISKKVAPTIGIAVDHRRKNRSEESLNRNVERLKLYMSQLIVFPRKAKLRKGFAGLPDDTAKTAIADCMSMPIAMSMPITQPESIIEAREITEADRAFNAFKELKKAKYDGRKKYKRTRAEALKQKMYENREGRRQHKAMKE